MDLVMPDGQDIRVGGELLSLKGRSWSRIEVSLDAYKSVKAKTEHPLLAQIAAGRGLDGNTFEAFLNPMISKEMPEPFTFLGMEAATARVSQAIREKERIGIWSDYDCDGATSAAVLGWFLRMCGHDDFVVRIPDRLKDGYGPNTAGILSMRDDDKCDLVCVLDSGIVAFEPLTAAQDAGMEIVVVDHHMAEDTLPPAVAIVNPNRKDQPKGFGHLCAAGVTFVLAVAVARDLRDRNYFGLAGVPDLMELLDLVALGTVCDVVPLTGLNRAFVSVGEKYLSKRKRPGIAALALAAGHKETDPITAKECGWILGPRINAGGRISNSDSGALLLLEQDPVEATAKAEALNAINVARKELDGYATEVALGQMAGRDTGADRTLALAVVEDAHEGVVGISASRVKDYCGAPAIVLTRAHDGTLKGSARSVGDFDIGHAIIAARQAGIIIKGGGHGMAGGLTLEEDRLKDFKSFMDAEITKSSYYQTGIISDADAKMKLAHLDVASVKALDVMRPFGTANREPLIILEEVQLDSIKILKEKHFKLALTSQGRKIDGMMWGVVGTDLGDEVEASIGRMVDVYGTVGINEFPRGTFNTQMIVEDIRYSAGFLS
jgi:single-stranded-DNA-specific exonuclease